MSGRDVEVDLRVVAAMVGVKATAVEGVKEMSRVRDVQKRVTIKRKDEEVSNMRDGPDRDQNHQMTRRKSVKLGWINIVVVEEEATQAIIQAIKRNSEMKPMNCTKRKRRKSKLKLRKQLQLSYRASMLYQNLVKLASKIFRILNVNLSFKTFLYPNQRKTLCSISLVFWLV